MIKNAKEMIGSGRILLLAASLACAALAGFGALRAQDDVAPPQDDTVSDPLNLPQSVTLLAPEDPNVRKATAVVNGFVITGTDIDQRMALVLDANKEAKISDQDKQRLREQVFRNLIDETLQIQAAKSDSNEVKPDEVAEQFNRVAEQNGKTPEELAAYLTKIGSSKASLQRQIEGELAWRKVLQRNVTPFINVSADEVNEVLDRMKASKGTDEYRVGEIYLSATPEAQQAVFDNAKRIVDQLKQGGNFAAYARQFSEASTAAVGGDLGWIRLPQLPSELASAVAQLQPGQLVGPVQVPGGYSIIYLIDRRQVLTADPRDAVLSLKQISISFPQGTTEDQAKARLADFTTRVKQIRGCGDAEAVASAIGAEVVTNDQVKARALPDALQSVLLNLQVGQATPPFGSVADGVRVLMLCGRDDPQQAAAPKFEDVMNQLEDDRINKRAQRYLRDLRRDAIIEYN
ncbi:MAG TPA: peptidylprolyl isomerase [Sphingomonadaceae bacterium]